MSEVSITITTSGSAHTWTEPLPPGVTMQDWESLRQALRATINKYLQAKGITP